MNITPQRTATCAVAALAGAMALAQPAGADAVSEFYSSKPIRIVVGYAPGGGADLWARFLSRHLGKHVPGKPNIIVQNMPGAGGFTAVNYVYNVAPQDGTYIILPTTSAIPAPAMGLPNVKWDVFKLNWLGNLARDVSGCVTSGKSGIKSATEAQQRQIVFGADGMDDPASHVPRVLNKVLGYKTKVIAGYKGTGPALFAVESGEIDARCSFWASMALGPNKGDMASGKFVPILQVGSRKHPVFGNAPSLYDLARNEDERQIMNFIFGPNEISRPYAASPGSPKDRVAALRKAFWAAATSAELKADAERLNLIIDPMTWEETEAAFRTALDVPKPIIERAKAAISY